MSDLENEESSSTVSHQQQLLIRVVEISYVLNVALSFHRKRYCLVEALPVVRVNHKITASFVNLKHDVEV